MSTSSWTIAHWGAKHKDRDSYDVELHASVPVGVDPESGPQRVSFSLYFADRRRVEIRPDDAKLLIAAKAAQT